MTTSIQLTGEERFEFSRQLSDSLQGRIYSAIDKNTGKHVVVKETWKQLVKEGKSRSGYTVHENCEQEKRILKYLSNEDDAPSSFVRHIDEWEDNDSYLFAMEMCSGGELLDYVKSRFSKGSVAHCIHKESQLKQEEMSAPSEWMTRIQHIFNQMVRSIAFMHSKHVCHLDLSLENVMIASSSKNTIKIIDFGAAQCYPDGSFVENRRIGKVMYMAPEVFMKKTYDARSADIWSLGVILFMMLIGAPAFESPSDSNAAFKYIVNGRLRDVLKQWKRLRFVTKDALDLLNQIFEYEPQRITMDHILKHPFVHSIGTGQTQHAQTKQ
eukprot:35227_1